VLPGRALCAQPAGLAQPDNETDIPTFVQVTHKHNTNLRRWRMCYLDEHYVPSLLAFHGLDNETDCRGGLVTANWTGSAAGHPLEYTSSDVNPQLCVCFPVG